MFKTYTGIAPQTMNEVFPRNYALNYNLRPHPKFASRAINTVHYDSESLSFLRLKIWEMLPLDLKNSDSLDSFISGTKNWRPQECPCRLCKTKVYSSSRLYRNIKIILVLNPFRLDPTEWSDTLKQFICNSQRIIGVCLTVLWDQVVKG